MQQTKLFLLGGPVFVALVVASILAFDRGNIPDSGAGPKELASFYNDHATSQGVAAFVLAASVPFLVLFGIGLLASVGRDGSREGRREGTPTGGSPTAWGYVLLTGVILSAGAVLIAAFAHFALVNGGDEGITPSALQALNALDGNSWMTFNPAFGVLMIGAAGAMISAGIKRGLGWVALVLGIAAFVPFADFFALAATLLWIVVTAIVLVRSAGRAALIPAPGAA